MFENIVGFFKKLLKKEEEEENNKDMAKERLHLVLMQDRANVSADFLELMKQEIIEVIKKYIDIDEGAIDVRLTNKENEDGTNGAPALYANIPILNIKNEARKMEKKQEDVKENKQEESKNKENKKDIKQEEKGKETETKNQEDKIEKKDEMHKDQIENEEKSEDKEEEKKEENTDSENKQDIAEEKETKEELNQNKK